MPQIHCVVQGYTDEVAPVHFAVCVPVSPASIYSTRVIDIYNNSAGQRKLQRIYNNKKYQDIETVY